MDTRKPTRTGRSGTEIFMGERCGKRESKISYERPCLDPVVLYVAVFHAIKATRRRGAITNPPGLISAVSISSRRLPRTRQTRGPEPPGRPPPVEGSQEFPYGHDPAVCHPPVRSRSEGGVFIKSLSRLRRNVQNEGANPQRPHDWTPDYIRTRGVLLIPPRRRTVVSDAWARPSGAGALHLQEGRRVDQRHGHAWPVQAPEPERSGRVIAEHCALSAGWRLRPE